jgi:hypothetical protein
MHSWRKLLVAAFGIGLTLAANAIRAEELPEEGFTELFDGETLAGWDGNPKLWKVENGAIVGTTTDEEPLAANEFLILKDDVGDFVLRLQFRVAARGIGNSGIQYRSHAVPEAGKWAASGYQADIDRTNKYMGILYEERGRGILAEIGEKVVIRTGADDKHQKEVVGSLGDPSEITRGVEPGQWVNYEVSAQGNHLVHKVNGRVTVDVTDLDIEHATKRGKLALQLHVGPAMQIEFRRIRIRENAADE